MLFIIVNLHCVTDYLERRYTTCAIKTVYYHLDKAIRMKNMDTGKWEKKTKILCLKRKNNFAKGRHRVLSPHMTVCVCIAYKQHTPIREATPVRLMPILWAMWMPWSIQIQWVKIHACKVNKEISYTLSRGSDIVHHECTFFSIWREDELNKLDHFLSLFL